MTIGELCRSCGAVIDAASRAVAAGATLDLAGFGDEVERLCEAAVLLPPGERASAAEALLHLREGLDDLAAALGEQQTRLRKDGERTARGRAAKIYGQTPNEPAR